MDDITGLTAVLDALHINHGTVRLHAAQHNMSYTDGKAVFCKVSRPGFTTAELQLELTLANHYGGILMLQPRHAAAAAYDTGIVTIWVWEPMTTLRSNSATAAECATAANLLQTLHDLETPPTLMLPRLSDFKFLQRKIEQRAFFAHQHGLTKRDTDPLQHLYDTFLGDLTYPAAEEFVLNHGDPHFGNLVRRGSERRLCYIDYESAQLAYPEFDIAAMHVNLAILGQNAAGWAAAHAQFAAAQRGIDAARFDAFTIARLISMTAYGLLHPNAYPAYHARMRALHDFYYTGNLPTVFPRVI